MPDGTAVSVVESCMLASGYAARSTAKLPAGRRLPLRPRPPNGSRLLAPTLARADDDGVPAYLETQKFENIAFYARHGFTVVHEVTLPGSPTVWAMQRNPR